jgi:hypothetical protein
VTDTTPPDSTILPSSIGQFIFLATDGNYYANSDFNVIVQEASSESAVTFTCTFDGASVDQCPQELSAPQYFWAFSGLSQGLHNFQVTATDKFSNVETTPSQLLFYYGETFI